MRHLAVKSYVHPWDGDEFLTCNCGREFHFMPYDCGEGYEWFMHLKEGRRDMTKCKDCDRMIIRDLGPRCWTCTYKQVMRELEGKT